MSVFNNIIMSSEQRLVRIFDDLCSNDQINGDDDNLLSIAQKFDLRPAQLILALGFNKNIGKLNKIFNALGYESVTTLFKERDKIYTTDIYRKITLDNIMNIYNTSKNNNKLLGIIRPLLRQRLGNVESTIESTINSLIIDNYKVEIKTIYADNIADLDFAEERLDKEENGFRALLNEVSIIADHKLIPIGDIFFRATILPEEKRKLLDKNLIPIELIESRVDDPIISRQERKMLNDFLARKT